MKQKRHSAILSLIEEHEIETQEQLTLLLSSIGIEATQATVSRDIKELQLIKASNGHGGYKYVCSRQKNEQKNIISHSVLTVDSARNILIIKTRPGMAAAAAAVIDSMSFPEIVGSLAGDDTVFCVTKEDSDANRLTNAIRDML